MKKLTLFEIRDKNCMVCIKKNFFYDKFLKIHIYIHDD